MEQPSQAMIRGTSVGSVSSTDFRIVETDSVFLVLGVVGSETCSLFSTMSTATGHPNSVSLANTWGLFVVLATHTLKLVPSAGSKVCPTYNPVFNCRVSIMAWSLGSFIDNIVMGAGTSICERGGISVGSWTSIRLHLMCPLRVKVTAGCPLMPKLSVAKSQTHWLAFSQSTGIRDQLILHNRSQAYNQLMADNGQISWALDYTQRTSIKNLCYWKGWTIKRTNPRM